MTLKLNRHIEVVKVHVHASVGSRNTNKPHKKIQVTLTFEYDLEIQQGFRGCRGIHVREKFHQAECSGS